MNLPAPVAMALATLLPLGVSAAAVTSLLGSGRRRADRLLAASLSPAGLGLASIPVFAWRLAGGRLTGAFAAADFAGFGALAVASSYLARRARRFRTDLPGEPSAGGLAPWIGVAALAVVAGGALWGSVLEARLFPHGQWDAWAVWNLRARWLHRAADGYRALLADPPLSHFDYPLLLPASVARLWAYTGRETTLAPIGLAFLFTFGAAALCGSSLAVLRGGAVATAASALLLANSDFLAVGLSQYADVPVGYYLLAALALAAWQDATARPGARPWALLLAGLAAGLAAWTKNEGLLFAAAFAAARAAALRRCGWSRAWREASWLGAGLALPLATVVLYRVATPHASWLLGAGAEPLTDRLRDASRLGLILKELALALFRFGAGAALAAVGLAVLLWLGATRPSPRPLWPLATVGLVLAGYVLVFLATPLDLRWQLDTTIVRLLSQLWPASVFALFLAATPDGPPTTA